MTLGSRASLAVGTLVAQQNRETLGSSDTTNDTESGMSGFNLPIGVACAMLFFRAAQYEKMSPSIWAIASFGLLAILTSLASGLLLC